MSHDHETFLIIIKIENRCDASFQYVDYFYLFISLLIDMITLLVYWNNSDSILILHDPQPPLNPFCRFHKFPQQSLQKTCKFQMGLVSMQSDPFPQPFCSNRVLHRKTGAGSESWESKQIASYWPVPKCSLQWRNCQNRRMQRGSSTSFVSKTPSSLEGLGLGGNAYLS